MKLICNSTTTGDQIESDETLLNQYNKHNTKVHNVRY